MKKWQRDENGLFVTICENCGKTKRTKKRPYGSKMCQPCASRSTIKIAIEHNYGPERNKKISEAQKERWSGVSKKKRSETIKDWMSDYLGSEQHLEMCLKNQKKATAAAMEIKEMTAPEVEFAEFLQELEIPYETQYFLEQFPFDFYLPDTQQLVEIDGEFWHPLTEDDCKYPAQKHNFERDKRKNLVAKDHGFRLTRMRIAK